MGKAWSFVGASVIGTSHRRHDLPCQDAHAVRCFDKDILAIAVADGAGSAREADRGAALVIATAMAALEHKFSVDTPQGGAGWGGLLAEVFHQTREILVAHAYTNQDIPRDYACTLTVLISNKNWLITGQIGDGCAVARGLDGSLTVIAEPQRGEYANETFFLTDDTAADIFDGRVYELGIDLPEIDAVAVMSDGLLNLALDKTSGQPHPPFFNPLLTFPSQKHDRKESSLELMAFLDSPRVNQRTDDDKTLVLAAHTRDEPVTGEDDAGDNRKYLD